MEDLARLGDDLPLLTGIAVVHERVDLRQHVECDLVGVNRGNDLRPSHVRLDLPFELGDRLRAGAGDGLVGIDDHAPEANRVAKRGEHRRELHRRAVRVGDDAVMLGQVFWVDLADNEGHPVIHAPRRRVVDDHRAAPDRYRGHRPRLIRTSREQRDVDAVEGFGGRLGDRERSAADGQVRACRPRRRQRSDLAGWKAALEEDLEHRPADQPRGADHRHRRRRIHGVSSWNASCSAWAAL